MHSVFVANPSLLGAAALGSREFIAWLVQGLPPAQHGPAIWQLNKILNHSRH
jgi:hypothetical protein